MVFFGKVNTLRISLLLLHESAFEMALPLVCLAFGSIFFGFIFKDLVVGFGSLFLSESIGINLKPFFLSDFEFILVFIKLLPLFIGILSIVFYFLFLRYYRENMVFYNSTYYFIFIFFLSKWYFDRLYNSYINLFFLKFAKNWIYIYLDKGLFELLGPYGI
jgi:NADH-ubiquinone oxidoreductase chain 5